MAVDVPLRELSLTFLTVPRLVILSCLVSCGEANADTPEEEDA